MAGKKDLDFESSLKKLEGIVRELESSEVGLSDSLQKFEEGIALYKNCRKSLDEAEQKIKILSDSLKELDYKD